MDIFFTDPDDAPVPPEKVEIRQLIASPYEDQKRVTIEFEITPFQQKPNIEIEVFNPENHLVSSLSVVEAIENKMQITLHLKEAEPKGNYTVNMHVFYSDLSNFGQEDDLMIKDLILDNLKIVASSNTHFSIPNNLT